MSIEIKTFPVAEVLAWSEALTLSGVSEPLFYFWKPERTTVVLGLSQDMERELLLNNIRADGVEVLRRSSGGGAVVLGDGILCFGVFMPVTDQVLLSSPIRGIGIHESFSLQTSHVVSALKEFGIGADISGVSDIAYDGYKLAGCAQLRKRNAVLVHGTLLVDTDRLLMERYLAFPSKPPDYRGGRGHGDFCRNVVEIISEGSGISLEEIADEAADQAFEMGWHEVNILEVFDKEVRELMECKYSHVAWNMNRRRRKM